MRSRPARTSVAALALVLTAGLAACSSSGGGSSGGAGTSTATGGASTTVAGATSTAAGATTAATDGPATTAASGECATLVEAVTEMAGTWQAYVQLPGIPDVARWKALIEPMGLKHSFAQTLDTLNAAFGADKDVAASITYMRTADGLVQKGLGGDTTAIAALKEHIGPNLLDALLKQSPMSKALSAKGC